MVTGGRLAGRDGSSRFHPQFSRAEAPKLAARYSDNDSKAEAAGRAIAAGDYAPRHAEAIRYWKAKGRTRHLFDRNRNADR
jgi:hypothetical protein